MNIYELTENYLELIINTEEFDENDLYIIKNLERLFIIKNTVKIQGHYVVTKHTNYKTELKDGLRKIRLPKYAGLNLMTKLKLKYIDKRKKPDYYQDYNSSIILYPNQKTICDYVENKIITRNTHSYILIQKAGTGKCMGFDTKIIMYNGTIKAVQDINIGDILMGDDSLPRKVLNLGRGRDEMYEISSVNGDMYTANSSHIMCLKYSIKPYIVHMVTTHEYIIKWFNHSDYMCIRTVFKYENEDKYDVKSKAELFLDKKTRHCDDDVIIKVKDYLNLPKSTQRQLKGYKTGIDFPEKKLYIDPYILSYWLCEGEVKPIPAKFYIRSCLYYENLKYYNLLNNKHIPHEYKCNSKENRLKLLAGLLDSDGYLNKNCYKIIKKNEILSDDILFLARSLGFVADKKESAFKCGTAYYKIFISGDGLDEIPVLCKRNKAKPMQRENNKLRSSIKVKSIGISNYYGFVLDGNHKYILGDFTVTHNTISAIEIINRLKVKTLIVLPNLLLLNQWKTELLNNLDITEDEILIWCGQSNKKGKKNLTIYNNMFKIILTTIHTSIKIEPSVLNENEVHFTIYDEIHLYATHLFSDTFWRTQRYYNLGLTATPNKINGFEKIYIQHMNTLGHSDDIVPDYNKNKFNGNIKIIKNHIKYENILTETGIVSIPLLINKLCLDNERNDIIIKYIINLYDINDKHCIFVFSDRRNHLIHLAEIIHKQKNINVVVDAYNDIKVLIGGSKGDDIKDAINNSRVIFTTYQYSSVGVNIQKMNCLVLCTPRKHNHTQIVGRILRNGSDTDITRQIIDIVDCKSILYSQYYERKKAYIENNFKLEIINENK
jgi:superfamily II DNA or RNA helicase